MSFTLTDGVTESGAPNGFVPPHEPSHVLPIEPSGELAPVPTQVSVPVIELDSIDGMSQKAGKVATGPSLPAPIRR